MNQLGALAKMFIVLSGGTLGLFLALFLTGWAQTHFTQSPLGSIRTATAQLDGMFFVEMLSMELPATAKSEQEEPVIFTRNNIAKFLLRLFTDINPDDPRTFMAMSIPGMSSERATLLSGGVAAAHDTAPLDYTPPPEALLPYEEWVPNDLTPPDQSDTAEEPPAATPIEPTVEEPSSDKRIFIYHSHNRESWLPELPDKTKLDDAYDPTINVTLLGSRMAEKLEEKGIGAVSSAQDYPTSVPGYNWNFSYKYSLQTIREAFASYPDLTYYFDIHRDSQTREYTTATINGQEYAQLYFIIGHRNPNWQENEAFATEVNKRMEARYPGISRGVWSKSANSGHAEYNQSFSPHSFLIEVGGPENTLEESYRTIDALTEIISEYFWEAEAVSTGGGG